MSASRKPEAAARAQERAARERRGGNQHPPSGDGHGPNISPFAVVAAVAVAMAAGGYMLHRPAPPAVPLTVSATATRQLVTRRSCLADLHLSTSGVGRASVSIGSGMSKTPEIVLTSRGGAPKSASRQVPITGPVNVPFRVHGGRHFRATLVATCGRGGFTETLPK